MAKKIITVFGATGAQGGSVADIFLTDPALTIDWTVRAVTRDIQKESSKDLAKRGAEVVGADLNDAASIRKAIDGSTAVFAVTNYWESMDAAKEVTQGKALVDAAAASPTVKHFIWSSLLDIKKLSNGALPNVYHFDSKAAVESYARSLSNFSATFFMPGFYLSNLPGQSIRQFEPNGPWTLTLPIKDSAPMPYFDTNDTGLFVKAIVLNRDGVLGKRIYGATEYITPKEIISQFQEVFPEDGKTAKYNQVPPEVYKNILKGAGMPDFAAQELLENFLLFEQFGYFGGASLDETHALLGEDKEKLTTWKKHARESKKWGVELK
ncbi:hscarg protein [Rhypophila sp. PSN 637]